MAFCRTKLFFQQFEHSDRPAFEVPFDKVQQEQLTSFGSRQEPGSTPSLPDEDIWKISMMEELSFVKMSHLELYLEDNKIDTI